MRVSLSEIQTFITKACVEAGLPLGLAQDAGHAARHVIRHGSRQLETFVKAIDTIDQKRSVTYDIDKANLGHFIPSHLDKHLSALYAAPSACDLLLLNETQRTEQDYITLTNVDIPAVVIAEVSAASENIDRKFCLSWNINGTYDVHGICWQGSLVLIKGTVTELLSTQSSEMTLKPVELENKFEKCIPECVDQVASPHIEEKTWERILTYVDRSLVKATETSRLTGAGAGVIDKD